MPASCIASAVIKRALLLSMIGVLVACGGHREHTVKGSAATTDTVAPAAAQPAPTGTDAMTQTVDVGDGRSEADGGVTTSTTATAAPAKSAPAKKTKKH
jgi:hypothetical protein